MSRRYGWPPALADYNGLAIGRRVKHVATGDAGVIVGINDQTPEKIVWLVDFDHGGKAYKQADYTLLPES